MEWASASALLLITLLILFTAILYYRYRRTGAQLSRLQAEFNTKLAGEAQRLFSEWRQGELQSIREQIRDELRNVLEEQYRVMLQRWKEENEDRIREDAIRRSTATLMGRIGEHVAPLLIDQRINVDPRDLRFLGTPVDYVAFKGLSEGNAEEILFIEVKTGRSGVLTRREASVKQLVDEKRIRWVTFHIAEAVEEARALLEQEIERLLSEQRPRTLDSPLGEDGGRG